MNDLIILETNLDYKTPINMILESIKPYTKVSKEIIRVVSPGLDNMCIPSDLYVYSKFQAIEFFERNKKIKGSFAKQIYAKSKQLLNLSISSLGCGNGFIIFTNLGYVIYDKYYFKYKDVNSLKEEDKEEDKEFEYYTQDRTEINIKKMTEIFFNEIKKCKLMILDIAL
jgi:hypothetical protein